MNEFITYVGATNNKGQIRSGNFGFKGVFDGCGYAIDGLTKTNNANNGAFIGYLHNDGVIRNVAFTNAVYNSISGGFVVLGGGGLVENVYVQYAQFTFECNSGGWADSIGTFFADCYKDATATRVTTLRNCIVEFPENAVSYNAEGALQAFSLIVPSDNVTTVENVFAILPDQGEDDAAVRNQAFGPAGTQPGADDSFGLYTSYDELKAAVSDWSGWNGDIWDTSDGYPVFKDKAAA